jgi:hypothetical protein
VIDDTRLRFLKAIAAQLDVERIAEVHLFPAIRQGGMESGVAVLAVDPVRELAAVASQKAEATEAVGASSEAIVGASPSDEADDSGAAEEASASPYADSDEPLGEATADVEDDDADVDDLGDEEGGDDELEVGFDIQDDAVAAERPVPRRFTVYTARYRHTLKGPDRGKWEVSVTEEADAPLLTVDAVVRGVQRRSGDVDEIVRMSGGEVVALTGDVRAV